MQNTDRHGFTLIELSLVLAIIGLLVGGVIAGKTMMDLAAIRAQVGQFQLYQQAVSAFKLKYDCLPGDCPRASSFGLATSGGADGLGDGNGNGKLENASSGSDLSSPDRNFSYELPLFFIHLSKAKLIAGGFNGTFKINQGFPALAINDGKGMIAAGAWQAGNTGTYPNYLVDNLGFADGIWLHATICDVTATAPGGANDGCGVFTVNQAFAIDTKIDDGLPEKGNFWSYKSGTVVESCSTLSGGTIYKYNTSATPNIPSCQSSYRVF